MIESITKSIEIKEEVSLTCDKCGKQYGSEDTYERQEAYRFRFTGGYSSVFGDGNKISCDLCQHCLKELIGEFCKINSEVTTEDNKGDWDAWFDGLSNMDKDDLSDMIDQMNISTPNTSKAIEAEGMPIAILNHNTPVAYLITAEAYECLLDRLDDAELAQKINDRSDQKSVEVSLDDL